MNLKNCSILRKITGLSVSLIFAFILSACGNKFQSPPKKIIEETPGGEELIEREFMECDPSERTTNPYGYEQTTQSTSHPLVIKQASVQRQFPLDYSSIEKSFPLRGSWRKTKEEILDIVYRSFWSPEQNRPVKMLSYFDMVLLINTGQRSDSSPENSSAQRMQVLVRNGSSNHLDDWKRIHVWPISSGKPCGKKIETPTGVFKLNPYRFHSEYYSVLFEDVNMYETMFFYHNYQNGRATGVAIHGTYVTEKLGRRDSGGCIRLHRRNSKCLFNTLKGNLSKRCLNGGYLNYQGTVPSFMSQNGEADPEFLSNRLETRGYKVLVAIYKDNRDLL